MSNVKIKLDKKAVRDQLLKGEATKALIAKYGDAAYQKVSSVEGYKKEDRNYPERIGVAIYAKDGAAIHDNMSNNSLLKAVK